MADDRIFRQLPADAGAAGERNEAKQAGAGKKKTTKLVRVSQGSAIGSQESEVVDSTPPEDWMVEERLAAKRAEEKMAAGLDAELFVAKRPKAAHQIVVEEAGASEGTSVAKPAVAGGKKTKLVKVNQEYIDLLLKRYPKEPLVPFPEEHIQTLRPERREPFRAFMAGVFARLKASRDKDEAILEQYRTKGYAEEEIEVRDDEGDEEKGGEHDGRQPSVAIASKL